MNKIELGTVIVYKDDFLNNTTKNKGIVLGDLGKDCYLVGGYNAEFKDSVKLTFDQVKLRLDHYKRLNINSDILYLNEDFWDKYFPTITTIHTVKLIQILQIELLFVNKKMLTFHNLYKLYS